MKSIFSAKAGTLARSLAVALCLSLTATQSFADISPSNLQGCSATKRTVPGHQAVGGQCLVRSRDGKSNNVQVIISEGTPEEVAYDHGYLLAPKADVGVMKESLDSIFGLYKGRSDLDRKVVSNLVKCLTDNMYAGMNPEFEKLVNSYAEGMKNRNKDDGRGFRTTYSHDQMKTAAVAIEMGNLIDYIKYRVKYRGGGIAAGALHTILSGCRVLTKNYDFGENPIKMGCTGFVANKEDTSIGALIHARNLDADLTKSYNKAPTVFLYNEKAPAGKTYYKYVAAASAGLLYPGGISGFNEEGLSVSLHQMSPSSARLGNTDGQIKAANKELAPQLVQRMLREAKSISEAYAIAQKATHISSWTILISDSKDDNGRIISETASIEISSNGVAYGQPKSTRSIPQANHFLSGLVKDTYTPTVNKLIESLSREKTVINALNNSKGRIDEQWTANMLASHVDSSLPGNKPVNSSVGKVPVKVYSVMATIAVPAKNEIWITAGERMPAPHSTYVKFKVDFDAMTVTRQGSTLQANNTDFALKNSLAKYGKAYQALGDGNVRSAYSKLSEAIRWVDRSKMTRMKTGFEIPMGYLRARLATKLAAEGDKDYLNDALEAWNWLLEDDQLSQVPSYQRGLTKMFAAVAKIVEAQSKRVLEKAYIITLNSWMIWVIDPIKKWP